MAAPATWREILASALAATGVDELARRAAEAHARAWPVLREDDDLRALAQRGAAANLSLVAEIVRGEAGLSAEPPPAAAAYARELARRNVGMTELARSYRVGQHVMWRFGVEALRAAGADDQIEAYTDATFATGDVLMGAALERYSAERDRWVRSADALRRETVETLLAGEAPDVDAAGRRLRYELRRTHVAFVVWGDGEDAGLEAAALAVGGPSALVVPFGAGAMAGWCPPEALDRDVAASVAFGLPGEGAAGFRRSHRQAMEAQRVARLGGLRGPVDYDDVALAALLTADLEQADAFARTELGALGDPGQARLADTALEVLAHQGSPRRAGERLGLHENTVAKRVRAAEEVLGRPITERPAQTLAALIILRTVRGRASSR